MFKFKNISSVLKKIPSYGLRNITGGQVVKNKLDQHGVTDLWIYTGGAIMPVIDTFYNSSMNCYTSCHEQSMGHAATAYARISNKPGVCVVTSGPGLTNLVTAITDAQHDSTPLIILSGQVPKKAVGSQAFQECPSLDITRSITKWNHSIKNVEEIPDVFDNAFRIATEGKPGVVHIDLPKCITQELYTGKEKWNEDIKNGVSTKEFVFPSETISSISDLINQSKKPIIIAGKGALDDSELVRTFALAGNIPVTTTIHGMGIFDENSDLSLEFLGMHGNVAANYAIQQSDLIINIGSRFDDRTTGNTSDYAPKAKEAFLNKKGGIIHVNISEDDIQKNIDSHYNFNCSSKDFLNTFTHLLKFNDRKDWMKQINIWKTKYPFDFEIPKNDELNTQIVISEINNWLSNYDDDYIITTGVGNHQMMASQYIKWTRPNSFVTSGSLGVMGVGLPFAIGSQIANKKALVIDIDGDGSFNQTLSELKTVSNYDLPIKIAIMNDGELSMVKAWEHLFFEGRYAATDLIENPDYIKLAESFGLESIWCDNQKDLANCVDIFLNHPGPILADFRVKSDLCLPLVKPGNALDDIFLYQETNDFSTEGMELPS